MALRAQRKYISVPKQQSEDNELDLRFCKERQLERIILSLIICHSVLVFFLCSLHSSDG